MECVCDYEPSEVYVASRHKARKPHKCYECHYTISPGENYERVFSIQYRGDSPDIANTCCRCLELRDYVTAHVPCFCWAHGNMIEDAIQTADGYSHEAPGLLFGAYRRQVQIKQASMTARQKARK